MNLKFIDLFAGIGGFHLALSDIGFECVLASEIDETARRSYIKNFYSSSKEMFDSNLFNKDIYDLHSSFVPNFDLICAGFPCQPFSQIGKKKGFNENFEGRGNLFFEIARIIEDKRPMAYLLENVQHLVKHDNGNTFKIIRNTLESLRYTFDYKVIKAMDFNLPQRRPRTFMVGFNTDYFNNVPFQFPEPIPLEMTMSDVFGGDCTREVGFTLRVGGRSSPIDDRRNWDGYIVNGEQVRLKPEQGLLMQGFPKNFYLADSVAKSMKLLGNSVAVPVVKEIGKSIVKHFDTNKK